MDVEELVFLSHLCGGEGTSDGVAVACFFLSHLCGGEEGNHLVVVLLSFLSHLCGGEVIRLAV